MSKHDINKAYVSPYDKFLAKFDKDHLKSPSQLKEIKKHRRIALLRDKSDPILREDNIWEDF